MAIVSDIIYGGLRKIGIRDTTNTTRMAEALACFNRMISSLDESIVIPTYEELTLTAGDADYSIGSGGDFDTVRPIKLVSAFIRDSDSYDYEVYIHTSREDYDKIEQKNLDNRPSNLLYVSSYPLGMIYFDSEPESAETFCLTSIKPYAVYTALGDTILQPIEYENFLTYAFAVEIAAEWNQVAPQTVLEMYAILKDQISSRNSEPVSTVKFSSELLR